MHLKYVLNINLITINLIDILRNNMSKDKKWKKKEIELVENYLTLKGDKIVISGQKKLKKAIKELPKNTSDMNDWCDKWLTEKGCKKLFKAIDEK